MTTDRIPLHPGQLAGMKGFGPPLFDLGRVVATSGVLMHLELNGMHPAALLSFHKHGIWGEVSEEDSQANDEAIASGARILSVHVTHGESVWIITDAEDEVGVRLSTCMMFASEY